MVKWHPTIGPGINEKGPLPKWDQAVAMYDRIAWLEAELERQSRRARRAEKDAECMMNMRAVEFMPAPPIVISGSQLERLGIFLARSVLDSSSLGRLYRFNITQPIDHTFPPTRPAPRSTEALDLTVDILALDDAGPGWSKSLRALGFKLGPLFVLPDHIAEGRRR